MCSRSQPTAIPSHRTMSDKSQASHRIGWIYPAPLNTVMCGRPQRTGAGASRYNRSQDCGRPTHFDSGQPTAERAGLGRVTWHQFRHIHSSLLNDLRVPVKIAQEQLGHASISTTLNIYTHVVDGSHRRAIEQLEAQLFPTGPKSSIEGTPLTAATAGKEAG
jgi:hypothetical protein